MTEKAVLPPIKAHQQVSFPLLRRPRPPPKLALKPHLNSTATSVSRNDMKSAVEAVFDSESVQEKLRAISTPVHPLPRHHPTPSSPQRYPQTITHTSTPTQHRAFPPTDKQQTDVPYCKDPRSVESDLSITRPRGPQFFPPGKMLLTKHRRPPRNRWERGKGGDLNFGEFVPTEQETNNFCEFVLRDSELDAEERAMYEAPTKLHGKSISRQNYLKLTSWFAMHIPQQATLNTLDITVDHQTPEGRKPYHQILLELEALIDKAIETSNMMMAGDERSMRASRQREGEGEGGIRWPTPNPGDIVFQSSTSRYFCGQGRSDSPFDGSGQPLISPAEVAMLESMLDGGYRLSLKAHFLSSLPFLSPLSLTLTHLNLSFNNLNIFPSEVLEMTRLQSLRMRNNPIRDIPNDILKLENLEDFCISFNLLTCLPSGLFELSSLAKLDVSHNALQHLSRDISKLRNLRMLNVESNELIALPPCLLSLPLSHLFISGNYVHPVLWKESCRSPPQALIDMCCIVVSANFDDANVSTSAKDILQHRCQSNACCDFCNGPIFGCELKVIKSMKPESPRKNCPVKPLPVLFRACSLSCKKQLAF